MRDDAETIYAFSLWSHSNGMIQPRDFLAMENADKAVNIAFLDFLAKQREEAAR